MNVYRHLFTKITFAIGVKVIYIKRVLGCLFVVCSLVCCLFVCLLVGVCFASSSFLVGVF